MSDYLGNLIARTASPPVAVRPQLPPLFEPVRTARKVRSGREFEEKDFAEQPPLAGPSDTLPPLPLPIPAPRSPTPAPAARETKSGRKFEQENFVEQPLVTGPSDRLAPTRLCTPTARQSVLRESEQTVPEVSPAKKTSRASRESEPALQPQILPRAAPTLREDDASDSTRRRSDIIQSAVREVIASVPASQKVSSRQEIGSLAPAVAVKPVVVRELRGRELPARSEAQPIVPTIRPLPPVAPLPPAAATASPAINVTIGRVEIRAVPPLTQQRPRPKPATVLSLEDYLRQRANGGPR